MVHRLARLSLLLGWWGREDGLHLPDLVYRITDLIRSHGVYGNGIYRRVASGQTQQKLKEHAPRWSAFFLVEQPLNNPKGCEIGAGKKRRCNTMDAVERKCAAAGRFSLGGNTVEPNIFSRGKFWSSRASMSWMHLAFASSLALLNRCFIFSAASLQRCLADRLLPLSSSPLLLMTVKTVKSRAEKSTKSWTCESGAPSLPAARKTLSQNVSSRTPHRKKAPS